jgi:hypothetical protein
LSNIYLNRLDAFVETVLIPTYTRGKTRVSNPAYLDVLKLRGKARRRGDRTEARRLLRQMRAMSSKDPTDPGYRRLRYTRYADDQLLGFTGPRAEAEEIKERLTRFLREDLKLELSQDKTLITHARTRAARFLGYDIVTQHSTRITRGRRSVNGGIALRVPKDVIKAKTAPYLKRGKPAHQGAWIKEDDHTIVATYGSIYRGIVQYYLLAGNVFKLNRLQWVMETSMLRTLAAKHNSSVSKMAKKHKAKIETPEGLRTCFEARVEREGRKPLVARFGGIPLKRKKLTVIVDRQPSGATYPHRELIQRFLHGRCELCTSTDDIHVHHVARLANLAGPGPHPEWTQFMAKRRRKTIVVCRSCYDTIHSGTPRILTQ